MPGHEAKVCPKKNSSNDKQEPPAATSPNMETENANKGDHAVTTETATAKNVKEMKKNPKAKTPKTTTTSTPLDSGSATPQPSGHDWADEEMDTQEDGTKHLLTQAANSQSLKRSFGSRSPDDTDAERKRGRPQD